MKKIIFFISIIFSIQFYYAQKIFSVKYESRADLKVFVVDYESQADLLVFKVKYESQTGKNDGKWFFVDYESRADKKIFFVDYQSRADLKIFFVDYQSRSGWKDNSKKHLLYSWLKIKFQKLELLNKIYLDIWKIPCILILIGDLEKHLVLFIIQEKSTPKQFQMLI